MFPMLRSRVIIPCNHVLTPIRSFNSHSTIPYNNNNNLQLVPPQQQYVRSIHITRLPFKSAVHHTPSTYDSVSSNDIKNGTVYNSYDMYLDVREQDEWNAGHIKNATHIPLGKILSINDVNDDIIHELDGQSILVYCRGGVRSAKACTQLQKYNMCVTNLSDGYIGWEQQQLPIEK